MLSKQLNNKLRDVVHLEDEMRMFTSGTMLTQKIKKLVAVHVKTEVRWLVEDETRDSNEDESGFERNGGTSEDVIN